MDTLLILCRKGSTIEPLIMIKSLLVVVKSYGELVVTGEE